MEERTEVFFVKESGKNVCRCKLCTFSCENTGINTAAFVEVVYSNVRAFCDSLPELCDPVDGELRERFRVTPYSFCFTQKTCMLSERIFSVNMNCSLLALFPGGKRIEKKVNLLFDEYENAVIPSAVSAFLTSLGKKKTENLFHNGSTLIVEEGGKREETDFTSFEKEYLGIMRKRQKGIDNFKKV